MKRLITAQDVENAKASGEKVLVDSNTIITPQALDVAKELEVNIIHKEETQCCEERKKEDAHGVKEENKAKPQLQSCYEPALGADEIYHILSRALEKGLLCEEDIKKLM